MTRAATARRLAAGAAFGGGGVGLAGAAFLALLKQEARAARRHVESRATTPDPPSGDGIYGRGHGRPLTFAVLGDSSAVGLGVERAAETPGVLLAAALAELAERRSGWSAWPCPARSPAGSTSRSSRHWPSPPTSR